MEMRVERRRVAVLIDGDNLSPDYRKRVVVEAVRVGRVDLVRVYLGTAPSPGWLAAPGLRPMPAGGEKNGADLLLAIDAMELALSKGFDTFVIAASDRDHAHIALRLREHGCHVLGIGEEKAPAAFREACSEFRQIGQEAVQASVPVAASLPAQAPLVAAKTPKTSEHGLTPHSVLRRLLAENPGAGVPLGVVGQRMIDVFGDHRPYSKGKLLSYLQSQNDVCTVEKRQGSDVIRPAKA